MLGMCAACATSHEDPTMKRYPIKSGIVKYEYFGDLRMGSETVYFDRWGMRQASYTDSEMGGMTERRLVLIDGEWTYNINFQTMAGTKGETPFYKSMTEGSVSKDWTNELDAVMEQSGGELVGTEVLDGRKCNLWRIKHMNMNVWMWKGLPMKSETRMAGSLITRIATDVQVDVEIPDDKFQVPDSVVITGLVADPQFIKDRQQWLEQQKGKQQD